MYKYKFLILLLSFSHLLIGQNYPPSATNDNRISVKISPYLVRANDNFEDIGNNDFVFNASVEGQPLMSCITAKIPTNPAWWVGVFDPGAYALMSIYGGNSSRYKQIDQPNGWNIFEQNFTVDKDNIQISLKSYEDDKKNVCDYDNKDDGLCEWTHTVFFRNYPPNTDNKIKLDCNGYSYWFVLNWKGVPTSPNSFICDVLNNNSAGFLCSNICPTLGQYGRLTFQTPFPANFNLKYKWNYEIKNMSAQVIVPTFSSGLIDNYYNTPNINQYMDTLPDLVYNLVATVETYVYTPDISGGNYGYRLLITSSPKTIALSAKTPIYNGNPITIAPRCNAGKDGEILVDIKKLVSPVNPSKIQVSYRTILSYDALGKPLLSTVFGTDRYTTSSIIAGDTISKRDTLIAGGYMVQIGNYDNSKPFTSIVGCPLNIAVNVPARPLLMADLDTLPYTNTDVSCRNSSDGRIRLKVNGGRPPYKVTSDTLLPSSSWPRINVPEGRTGFYTFTGLSPETPYNFAITDSFNCPLNTKRRIDIPYTLTNPDTLRFQYVTLSKYNADTIHNTQWNVSCYGANNGSISAVVNEFTPQGSRRFVNPPFRLWVTGTTIQGTSYTSAPQQTVSTSKDAVPEVIIFQNLYAGNYTIHLQDNNGCTYSENYTLLEPPRLDISVIDFLDNKCAGEAKGMMKTKALGGTRPYRYYKDNLNQSSTSSNPYYLCYGIGYTTSCDNGGGNYQYDQMKKTYDTIATLSNLVFGNHTMFVKDTNGCVTPVTRYVNQPDQLSVTLTGKHISCKGFDDGTLRATGSGGTAPYAYNWSFNAQPKGNTDFIDSLFAGTYMMNMLDANNCATADNFEIRNPTDTLKATASVSKDPTCADREDAVINVLAEGGWTPKYFSLDGVKYQKDEPNFTKLRSGVYNNIHVRDGNGCIIQVAPVTIFDPGKLTATELQTSMVSCFGGVDGTIALSISGGNTPYSASLGSTLSALPDSIVQFQNLTPGNYTVHISDSKNCLLDKLVTVISPDKLQDSILNVTDAGPFLSNGSATIKAFGGTSPYSYKWANLQQNSFTGPVTMLNLSAGFKMVIITDSKRCVDTAYVGINNIGGPVFVSANTIPPTCSYSSDGSTTVNFTAATALTYTWVNGATGPTINNLSDGIYYVTATDANGLISTKIDTVRAPAPLEVLFNTKPSLCFGDCKGEIQATLKGGTQPYGLQWNDQAAQTTAIAGNLCEGLYKLDITDANACIKTDSINLFNPDPVEINLGDSATICSGQVMTLDAQNPGSTYSWSGSNPDFTASSQSIQVSGDGDYYVSIVTPYGCLGADTFKLKSSIDLLDALFYVSTKNFAGDTVVFVNVSYPFPETISWEFGNNALVLKSEPPAQYVIFPEAGFYDVKMTAFLGECTDTISKRIKIFEQGDIDGYSNGRVGSSVIQSLNVYPNPNEGSFQVVLNLNTEYESEIIIHDFTGTVVKQISQDKNTHFEIPFTLNQMAKGVYFVRAMAGGESMSVLVTVQ